MFWGEGDFILNYSLLNTKNLQLKNNKHGVSPHGPPRADQFEDTAYGGEASKMFGPTDNPQHIAGPSLVSVGFLSFP